jgi:hypothetical protein
MEDPIKHYWSLRIEALKTALEKNNFEVHLAPRTEDVARIVTEDILPTINPTSMSWGGSRTFVECGLYRQLRTMSNMNVIDTYDTRFPTPRRWNDGARRCWWTCFSPVRTP